VVAFYISVMAENDEQDINQTQQNNQAQQNTQTDQIPVEALQCPICHKMFPSVDGVAVHMYKMHDKTSAKNFLAKYAQYTKQRYKFTDNIKEQSSGNIGGGSKMSDDNKIDIYEELERIISQSVPSTFKKTQSIINMFQREDPKDIKSLKELLELAAIPPVNVRFIIKAWTSYLNIPDELDSDEEEQDENETDDKSHGKKQTKDTEHVDLDKLISDRYEEIIKAVQSQIKLRTLLQQAKQLGIDLSEFGLSNDAIPNKKDKQQEEDDDPIGDYEFPPDSGKFIKMRSSLYTQRLIEWERAHNKPKEENNVSKEQTVPWKDPTTGTVMQVPISQYPNFVAMTNQMVNPMKMEFERLQAQLDEEKKKTEVLLSKLDNKDKEAIVSYIEGLERKLGDAQNKIKELETRDPLESAQREEERIKKLAEMRGYRPADKSVQDEATIKKIDAELEVVRQGVGTLAKKIDTMGSNLGKIVDAVQPAITMIAQDTANVMNQKRRQNMVPIQQYSDQQIIEMNKRIEQDSGEVITQTQQDQPLNNNIVMNVASNESTVQTDMGRHIYIPGKYNRKVK